MSLHEKPPDFHVLQVRLGTEHSLGKNLSVLDMSRDREANKKKHQIMSTPPGKHLRRETYREALVSATLLQHPPTVGTASMSWRTESGGRVASSSHTVTCCRILYFMMTWGLRTKIFPTWGGERRKDLENSHFNRKIRSVYFFFLSFLYKLPK